MATPITISWAAPDTAAVSAAQTTVGAGNLLINGDLAVIQGSSSYAIFPNIFRTVSITSAGNLSGVNFTITGIGTSGTSISSTISGPNNDTVYTPLFFQTVTSVSVSGAVGTNVTVGSGTTGVTNPILWNYHATVCALGIEVDVTNTIEYSFTVTLDNIQGDFASFTPIEDMTDATTSELAVYNTPVRYYYIEINSSTNGSLIATFIQQGIT